MPMEFWTKLASGMGVWAFSMSFLQILLPPDLRSSAAKFFHRLYDRLSAYCYYDITEIDGFNTNDLYSSVKLYLSSIAAAAGDRLTLTRNPNSAAITFSLSNNNSIPNTFAGGSVRVEWEHVVVPRQSQTLSWRSLPEERRKFVLRAHKRDKAAVLGAYLQHVTEKAKEIRRSNRELLLYTNSKSHSWESVPFKHPSTFGTLAMDPIKKEEIIADLKDFCKGESFYRQTGRPWKRGYLLYGPPGTGKSSMIAAMANYLGYDVYDVELTEVETNSDLRKLLINTTSKSIIVIEDIDCSLNFTTTTRNKEEEIIMWENHSPGAAPISSAPPRETEDKKSNITLSGLLNFTDGLWSCCGSKRIFIFTTNHAEKLDPALLRRGRMDMHIHMNYCSFPALKILVKNYLGFDVDEHGEGDDAGALRELEEAIDAAEMTPADISEVLIKHTRDQRTALRRLVEETRVRVHKRSINGVGKKKGFGGVFEGEEEEKREMPQSYKKGVEEEKKGLKNE